MTRIMPGNDFKVLNIAFFISSPHLGWRGLCCLTWHSPSVGQRPMNLLINSHRTARRSPWCHKNIISHDGCNSTRVLVLVTPCTFMVLTFLSWLLQLNNSWNCADPRTAVVCFLSTSPYQRTQELPCCYSWFPCIVYSVQRNRNKLLKYIPSVSVRPSDSEDDPSMRNFEAADANVFFIEQKYKGRWC